MSEQAAGIGPGTQLGPYRIEAPLGSGGMGQVFVALDTKLDRRVAVKVIPPALVGETVVAVRFEREAKALASLNHPNILAIHDFGSEGDLYYSVTELLEGETLRSKIDAGPLETQVALRIAREIAEGLAAAHGRGIVHRDLKPSNVFITADGRVKILDFGLARREPVAAHARSGASEAPTVEAQTRPGTVVGTVGYMSPEQARGQPTDARTDLFALGVILYEMLSGKRPFGGHSDMDVLAAILTETPQPVSRRNHRIPPGVERLVKRLMEKDAGSRIQSAREAASAIEGAMMLSSGLSSAALNGLRHVISPVRAIAVVGAILLVGIAVVLGVGSALRRGRLPVVRPRQITYSPGLAGSPAISPDGNSVAYSATDEKGTDLWVVDRRGSPPLRLTTDGLANQDPAWLPDGSELLFTSQRGGSQGVWKVSRFGGTPTLVLPNAGGPAVSPDGTRIAFTRIGPEGSARIWVASMEGPTRERKLTGNGDGVWDHLHPAWSPDGRTLCYNDQNDLWLVPASGGRPTRLTADDPNDENPVWAPDGRHIYFDSIRESGWGLWRIPPGGGAMQRVTLGTGSEHWPSLSADGKRLAYATGGRWACTLLDRKTRARTTLCAGAFTGEPSFSPDGKWLALSIVRDGANNAWRIPLKDGKPQGDPIPVTDQRASFANLAYSPDGRWIAFHRVFEGRRHICISSADGGPIVPFTDGPGDEYQPEWSPDGSQISFLQERGGKWALWAAPVKEGRRTGEPRRIANFHDVASSACWLPDGKHLVLILDDGSGPDAWRVESAGNAPPVRLTKGSGASWITLDAASGNLLIIGTWGGSRNDVRAVPPGGGDPRPLNEFETTSQGPELMEVEASHDGRYLALAEAQKEGDVWMLEALKGTF